MSEKKSTPVSKDAAAKKGGLHQFLGIHILKARLFQVFYQCAL